VCIYIPFQNFSKSARFCIFLVQGGHALVPREIRLDADNDTVNSSSYRRFDFLMIFDSLYQSGGVFPCLIHSSRRFELIFRGFHNVTGHVQPLHISPFFSGMECEIIVSKHTPG
jgi:hypothetical protein